MKKIILLLIILSINFYCKTTEEKIESVEYSQESKDGYYPIADKRVKDFLLSTKQMENISESFTGKFTMVIKSGEGLKTKDSLDGNIFYDKASGKIKIQLLDPFFGAILTQIISDSEQIKIRPLGQNTIQTLPMGDIYIKDPSGKTIPIPFPVIYHTITMNFSKEFSTPNVKANANEKKVKVTKGTDEFLYSFYPEGLESLEVKSGSKNLQAKCKVSEESKSNQYPPQRLLTRVTEISSGKDYSYVDIQYKNVKKLTSLPVSTFQF